MRGREAPHYDKDFVNIEKLIEEENNLLRSELGSNPLWAWKQASKLFFRVQKLLPSETAASGMEPQYDYKVNPETGLVELKPIYVDMPMLPLRMGCWVLARYVEANQEFAFKQKFGDRVEYPAGGIWQPIDVTALRPGITPKRMDTWNMIHAVRANNIAVREYFDHAEEKQDKQRVADRNNFIDRCRDRFTVGMEIPGTKGGVSIFSAKPTEPVLLKKEIQ